jgi:hypothetical protein
MSAIFIMVALTPLMIEIISKLSLEKTKISFDIRDQQFELLRKAVEDAVCQVHKVTENKEVDGPTKKSMAVDTAQRIATKLRVSDDVQPLIPELIESFLWKQESDDLEEDNY